MPSSQPSSKVSEMYLFPCPCPLGGAGEGFARSQLQSKKKSFPAGKARLVQGLEDVQLSWKWDIPLGSVHMASSSAVWLAISPFLHMVVDHALRALPCHQGCRNLLSLIPLQGSAHSASLLLTGDPRYQDGEGGRGTTVVVSAPPS